MTPIHYIVLVTAGGRYPTVFNRVIALTARKAHQLCMDQYLEDYDLPLDMPIETRTLFESDMELEAARYLESLYEQMERNNVGSQEHNRQHR